jgi:Stigma-specific protein, Stig1
MSPEARDHSFDELTRGLADGTLSRGKALRLMGGLLVGSALGSLPGVAWANDDDDDRCPQGQTRCGERCVNLRFNERHCGRCFNRCRSTQSCCNGRCVNLMRNERHCGECFNRCDEGVECVNGVCGGGEPMCGPNPPCPAGQECVQENCRPVCTPSCPQGTCGCVVSGEDSSVNICIAFGTNPAVDSCDQCPPADFPEHTVCHDIIPSPDVTILACGQPCP